MWKRILLLNLLALLVAGPINAWEVKLNVTEEGGVGGLRYVTIGVPLLAGQAKEVSELRLARKDAQGRLMPIPTQFRVLARWWRADNSIRWVLVDFATSIGARESQTFYLTNEKLAAPKPKAELAVEQNRDVITITTGPARFVINRKRFSFLEKAFVDTNSDGKFSDNENLLATTSDCGTVLEDTYGEKYYSSEGTKSVEIIESGPLRVCLRARGQHLAREGKGYRPGMYGYDVFLHFYAGGTDVYADVIITNNPPKSLGSPTFEDASLVMKLAGGAEKVLLTGDETPTGKPGEIRASSVWATLEDDTSVCLYQDSNGADTWEKCPGVGNMHSSGWTYPEGKTVSFRGYRVYKRSQGREEIIAEGDQARGLAHLWSNRGGLIVHTKHFWQQFPKAVEVAADGTLRLAFFPRETKVPHFLEDTSGKGHEIILHFYSTKAKGLYPTDRDSRPLAGVIADAWDHRLYPRPEVEHIAATGALSDLGPFTTPTQGFDPPGTKVAIDHPRALTTDKLYGNAYGWQVFGERWRSQGGHGKRGARQPISEDNYLWRWYVTGLPQWLAVGNARSRQFRDVRCYRVDEQDPFGFKDWQEFRRANRSEDWTNRPQPETEEYEKYSQGLWARSQWLFLNPEHTTLDLLYDRYLLFGDIRCFENMRIVAAHGGYFAGRGGTRLGGSWPWRAHGWGWRALERYWELTGDKAAEQCLIDTINGYQPADVKKEPGEYHGWFTQIYSRAAAMTALHTGNEHALELCKALALGKEDKSQTFSTLFTVLYHLTGEERYKKAVLGEGTGENLLRVGGYWPACDYWLLHQSPGAEVPTSSKLLR